MKMTTPRTRRKKIQRSGRYVMANNTVPTVRISSRDGHSISSHTVRVRIRSADEIAHSREKDLDEYRKIQR